MKTLSSHLNPEQFERNAADQAPLLAELHERLERAARGGSEKSRQRHVDRGKLLPRERVDALLDDGS
ncbi:MAG: methylcrotonoyl-CoA carboxylase, partial [Glutamicibacter sp.]